MYRTAFELLPQPCVIARLDDGALLAVNEAFLRMTDFTRVQVLGRSLSDLGASVPAGVLVSVGNGATTNDVIVRVGPNRTGSGIPASS